MATIVTTNAPPAIKPARTDVSVNGRVIATREIAREVQHHAAATAALAWSAAARALVVRALLLDEAQRRSVVGTPAREDDDSLETEEHATIRALIAREVVVPRATEAECRRVYERQPARFATPALWWRGQPVNLHGWIYAIDDGLL